MFKRRRPLTILQKAREFIYPRNGIMRALGYLGHRLRRLPDSPHKIALGLASGVFVSFSPMFGFHFIYAALVAWIVRGNVLASLIGTFFGNPLTFPIIAGISLWFGRTVLGLGSATEGTEFEVIAIAFAKAFLGAWQAAKSIFAEVEAPYALLSDFFFDLFVPYFLGGIIPGLIAGVTIYAIGVPLVDAYQKRRKRRFELRRARREKLASAPQQQG
ncbi:MAG: DUF2062 domain-containing protein [Pseudomonadota bacterium]